MYVYAFVVVIKLAVVTSVILVPIGKPIPFKLGAEVPFNSNPLMPFFETETLVFKSKSSWLTFGTIFDKPIQEEVFPDMKLETVYLSTHYPFP